MALGQTLWAKCGVAETVPVVDMDKGLQCNVCSAILPVVDLDKCIQCNVCSAICPYAVIRPFLLSVGELREDPNLGVFCKAAGGNTYAGLRYRIQASPDDCMGCDVCEVCTDACFMGALTMIP